MQLVILAAGMGSRFGGLKQMEKMDEAGNFLLDYSIYDAKDYTIYYENTSVSQSQRFSNGSPWTTASAFPGNLLEMPFPRPNPTPAESKPPT